MRDEGYDGINSLGYERERSESSSFPPARRKRVMGKRKKISEKSRQE